MNNEVNNYNLGSNDGLNEKIYNFEEDEPKLKKKKKSHFLLIAIILLFVVVGSALYHYYAISLSNEVILANTGQELAKSLNFITEPLENMSQDYDIYSDNGTLVIVETSKDSSQESSYSLDYDIKVNKLTNKVLLTGNTKVLDTDFIDFKLYYEDNQIYAFAQDIFDKYIKLESTDNNITNEELNYLKDLIKNSLKENIAKLDCTKTVKLGENHLPILVTKIDIDKDSLKDILNSLVETIKNDETAKNILEEISISTDDLAIEDEDVDAALSLNIESNLITGTLYSLKFTEVVYLSSDNDTSELTFEYNCYDGKYYLLKSDEESIEIEIASQEGNNFSGSIYYQEVDSDKVQVATFSGSGNTSDYTYYINSNYDGNISTTINFKTESNKLNYNMVINYEMEDYDFKISLEGTEEEIKDFTEDVSSSIDLDDLTEDDINTIYNNFLNKILTLYSGTSYDNYYYDDYDVDTNDI